MTSNPEQPTAADGPAAQGGLRVPAVRRLAHLFGPAPSIAPERDATGSTESGGNDIEARSESRPAMVRASRPSLAAMPPLPRRRRGSRSGGVSFLLCVVLPVLIACVYYARFASSQFVSEFKFAVSDTSRGQGMAAAQTGSALLGLMGAGAGAVNYNYIVVDYLLSREAVGELEKRVKVVSLYGRDSIDPWARFNALLPIERFVYYWQRMNTAQYDPITGIANVQVRAFSAEDANLIARTMVTLAEELINRINERMHADAVKFATKEVERGEVRIKSIRERLTAFRNTTGVIDVNSSLVASNSQLAQTLRGAIAQLETQQRSMVDQKLSPDSPLMMTIRAQIKAAQQQLASLESNVAKTSQGAPLSNAVAQFEQLDLERQFAQTMLTNAQQALDQARATAAAQLLYIEPYVRPNMPTSPTYPRPWVMIPLVALFAFVIWNLLRIAGRSISNHYSA